jgi:hypothetical protein
MLYFSMKFGTFILTIEEKYLMIIDEEVYAHFSALFEDEGIYELIDQVNTREEAAVLLFANKNFKQSILDAPPKNMDTNVAIRGFMTYQFYMKDLRWTLQAFFGEVTDEKSAKKLTKALINFYRKD